jgi:transporter family protein
MKLLLYSFILAVILGISPIIIKLFLNKIDMKLFFILNNIIFGIFIFMYMIYYWENFTSEFKTITIHDTFKIVLYTLVLSFIPTIIYYNLLDRHDLYIVTALISGAPIFTIGLSYMLLNEQITKYSAIGLVCICVGIILLMI